MNKTILNWKDVYEKLIPFDQIENRIYGVPSGGLMACALLKKATVVTDPSLATLILDDVIDSGKTKEFYYNNFRNVPFYALCNKKVDKELGWIVFPWEHVHPKAFMDIEDNITRLLQYIEDDPTREGLIDTPKRVIKSYSELFAGYSQNVEAIFTVFESDGYDQIVLLKSVELYSMCEHHMLPFFGKAHIAYIPDKKIVGISKLARLLEIYARRLQIQERIGDQVTAAIMKYLEPKGAACIIEAKHTCMCMRGVNKQNSIMTTSSLTGIFLTDNGAKNELIQLINL